MFGFFGKYCIEHSQLLTGFVSGTTRLFPLNLTAFDQLTSIWGTYEYDPSNSGSPPDLMALINTVNIAFNPSDFRLRINITKTGLSSSSIEILFKITDSTSRRRFQYNSNASVGNKLIKAKYIRPEYIDVYSTDQGTTSMPADFYIPYFINLKHLNLGATGETSLRNIFNMFPPTLEYFSVRGDQGGTGLQSIQYPLPASVLGCLLATGSNAFGTSTKINNFLANALNLKHLLFNVQVNNEIHNQTRTVFQASTSINIAHMTQLETLQLNATNITDISYGFTTIKNLVVYSGTSLDVTTLRNIINVFLSTSDSLFLNVGECNLSWTRGLSNSDISSTVTFFAIQGNRFTGTISITTAKSNLLHFFLGRNAVSITTAANKHNFATTDISGLTGALTLDLSNSRISNLTLPVNTVCTFLALGGNYLDTTVLTSLMSQITAMSALVTLSLCAGNNNASGQRSTNVENGQNSTNGFGTIDISALTNLQNFDGIAAKLTGSLTIHANLLNLNIDTNNVTGIAGTGALGLLSVFCRSNASFNFDFTRVANVTGIRCQDTAIVTLDLSGRTSTADWQNSATIMLSNVTALTSVIFPTTQARMRIAVNTGSSNQPEINFSGCSNLSSMTNMENINYSSLLSTGNQRRFIVSGCSLNQDLKIGINNFLPSGIELQNNGMSNANVDLNIDNIYQNRTKWNTTLQSKTMNIAGTNAAPSGTYQAPAGFVLGSNDGAPASAKEQVYVLVNNYGWTITQN